MEKTPQATETTAKAPTLKSLAMGVEKGSVNPGDAKKGIREILSGGGFTDVYFDTENPNKMVFKGSPDNALLTLDRMDADKTIDRATWRVIREAINAVKNENK